MRALLASYCTARGELGARTKLRPGRGVFRGVRSGRATKAEDRKSMISVEEPNRQRAEVCASSFWTNLPRYASCEGRSSRVQADPRPATGSARVRRLGSSFLPAPRRELVHAARRVAVDALQHVGQPGVRVDPLHAAGAEEAVEPSGPRAEVCASSIWRFCSRTRHRGDLPRASSAGAGGSRPW